MRYKICPACKSNMFQAVSNQNDSVSYLKCIGCGKLLEEKELNYMET